MTPRLSRTNDVVRLSLTRQEFARVTAAARGIESDWVSAVGNKVTQLNRVLEEILGPTIFTQLLDARPRVVELVVVDR